MIGRHSHQDRPAFSDILAGTLTVGTDGSDVWKSKPGKVITEAQATPDWGEHQHRGKSTAVLVGVDLVKQL